jgi:hypothetical protein
VRIVVVGPIADVDNIPATGAAQGRWGISRAQRCEIPNDAVTAGVIVQSTTVGGAKCTTTGAATRRWGIGDMTWQGGVLRTCLGGHEPAAGVVVHCEIDAIDALAATQRRAHPIRYARRIGV